MPFETSRKDLTDLMTLRTIQTLQQWRQSKAFPIHSVKTEQTVVLQSSGREKAGRFDFLIEMENGELVGIEVLSRPTKGKLKAKLAYSEGVDKFVFVLPHDSMELYQNPKKSIYKKNAKHALGREFNSPKLFVWPFHTHLKQFFQQQSFSKWFNVKA